jgi:DNA-binding NarL/FixJ family response regulator
MRLFLEAYEDIEVVGDTGDESQALRLAFDLAPDVVLIGLAVPIVDELEIVRRIKAAVPDTELVLLSGDPKDDLVAAAVQAGAASCVLRGTDPLDIVAALRAAYRGELHLDRATVRRLVRGTAQPANVDLAAPLTQREHEVTRMLVVGAANADIARTFGVSRQTAMGYVRSIMAKLGVASRTLLILYALKHKLVDGEDR